jgi:hypothetical protein
MTELGPDGDCYFDLPGAAAYVRLSVRTLQRFLVDPVHPLPAYRVQAEGKRRGRVLISRRALDAWMENFVVGGPKPKDTDMDAMVAEAVRRSRG